jgi:hypothetical protein
MPWWNMEDLTPNSQNRHTFALPGLRSPGGAMPRWNMEDLTPDSPDS